LLRFGGSDSQPFTQYPFLKEYVELNTKRRQEADGEFRKFFFKLMNNAVFEKTMENLRNRVDITLIHKVCQLLAQVRWFRLATANDKVY
jgi:hypothetical protein